MMELTAFDIQRPFEPGVCPPESTEAGWWFVFQDNRLLLHREPDGGFSVPCLRDPALPGIDAAQPHYLGRLDGVPCYTADDAGREPPPGLESRTLFTLHGRMDRDLYLLAGRAFQILEWDRQHRFCGRCGTPMKDSRTERSRHCPSCGLIQFPRLTPAMMALVRRDRQLLLARSPRFPDGFYSVLAGFAEPGETMEACVRREVREEVGLEVENIRYFASQSWPFPHSMMLAYVMDHAGGDIRVDDHEIIHADWFDPENIPAVPGEMSIAGHLIRWFLRDVGAPTPEER